MPIKVYPKGEDILSSISMSAPQGEPNYDMIPEEYKSFFQDADFSGASVTPTNNGLASGIKGSWELLKICKFSYEVKGDLVDLNLKIAGLINNSWQLTREHTSIDINSRLGLVLKCGGTISVRWNSFGIKLDLRICALNWRGLWCCAGSTIRAGQQID